MNIKPLANNVFLEAIRKENKSGIIIPETAHKEMPVMGKVIAIGPKVQSIKINDKVLFKRYMVENVRIDDKEYFIGSEDGIISIIE